MTSDFLWILAYDRRLSSELVSITDGRPLDFPETGIRGGLLALQSGHPILTVKSRVFLEMQG